MWNHIHLIKKLGEGGMGEVWLAYHAGLAAQFAVKKLKPELARVKDIKRFLREANHLKTLRHPNIVRVVDISDDPAILRAGQDETFENLW
jgi:serine/threonine protein kinase